MFLIENASSLEGALSAARALYAEFDPERLTSIVEKVEILAQLTGRRAVLEDV
jgi:hypothetical protein